MRVVERLIPAVNPLALQFAQVSAMSDALTLASAVRRTLLGPTHFLMAEDGKTLTVEGRLNLSHEEITTRTTALCTFVVPLSWRQKQPLVWCREPWRKLPLPGGVCNAEWHVLGNGSLCYELPHRWQDEIAAAERIGGAAVVVELAGEWVLNSVRWLLYRHLEAFRHNLPCWENERWPAWGHYHHGLREYLQMKARAERAGRQRVSAEAA